jgi:hypothetical protein
MLVAMARPHRARITACTLMCALLASCGKSRVPSAIDAAPRTVAGADGPNDAGGAAGTAGGGAGMAAAASSAGHASAAGEDGGSAGSAGAQPPATDCRRPWYQCPIVCSQQLIQGATRSFGECDGECSFMLELRPTVVLDGGTCVDLDATLTVQNTDGSTWVYAGSLTAAAWERLALLSMDLAAVRSTLPAVSGCPDCADGGAASVVLSGLDQLTETFAYPYDDPPAALRQADEFLQALIDELRACAGSLLASCESMMLDPGPDTDPNAAACRFVYSSASSVVSCSMPPESERACAIAADCLCRSGILQDGPLDIDACVDSWLTPRGAVTFADVCTQGQTDLTGPLPSALASFASAHDATVSTSDECDAVSAYY